MSRSQATQPQRTQNNPLVLGSFSTTSVRRLRGSLGPKYQVVGRADTRYESNGGFGGGTYNHWFQINLEKPAWIIITKGPPRPKYIQVSAYDLNKTPFQGDPIFDADSIRIQNDGTVYIPYLNTVTSSQSDLYNQFSNLRLDRGDERYYPLAVGSYLICVSSTRNEPIDYEVAVVVEFTPTEGFMALEDDDGALFITETKITVESLQSPVTVDVTLPALAGAFTNTLCEINSGVTVTIPETATWLIGFADDDGRVPGDQVLLEPVEGYYDTVHDHSLSEWRTAWTQSHQDTDPFPDILIPLTNRV